MAMRDHSTDASPNPSPLAFLSGGNKKSFGFRDDANAQNNGGEGGVLSAALDLDDEEYSDLDEDHRLLLQSSLPLLRSRNSAVVLAVCSLHYYCGVASIKVRLQWVTLFWMVAAIYFAEFILSSFICLDESCSWESFGAHSSRSS